MDECKIALTKKTWTMTRKLTSPLDRLDVAQDFLKKDPTSVDDILSTGIPCSFLSHAPQRHHLRPVAKYKKAKLKALRRPKGRKKPVQDLKTALTTRCQEGQQKHCQRNRFLDLFSHRAGFSTLPLELASLSKTS